MAERQKAYLDEEKMKRCSKELVGHVDDLSAEGYAREF